MRYAPRALLAGGLGFAVSLLVACGGGGGLLSSSQASNLNAQLDQVSAALDSHQCGSATSAVTSFDNAVANLPSSVSPTLTKNLKQGATTVAKLATRDCKKQQAKTTSTTPTSTTATASTSTATTQSTPSATNTAPPSSNSTPATTPGGSGTSSGPGTGGAGVGGGSGGRGRGGGGGGGGNGGGGGGSGGAGSGSGNFSGQ